MLYKHLHVEDMWPENSSGVLGGESTESGDRAIAWERERCEDSGEAEDKTITF